MNASLLVELAQLMLVNVVLSGDNAMVIALAARHLPQHQQRTAMLWGSVGAIVLRAALTGVAAYLLTMPLLQFMGGILLIWIAAQLLIEEDEPVESHAEPGGLAAAVRTILLADVVMSLDNILAIAGVAKGNWTLLLLGLALSIPLIVAGSTLIMKCVDRFPVIVYAGAALIAWTAGEMMMADASMAAYLPELLRASRILPLLLTVAVVAWGWYRNQARRRSAREVQRADVHAAERFERRAD